MGACGLECGATLALCGGDDAGADAGAQAVCADTQTDRNHCGACGTACAPGQFCQGGVCTLTCPQGSVACNGLCVDQQTDDANCGACGTACAPGQSCTAGGCATTCAAPLLPCGDPAACTNTAIDPTNCGACGAVCAPAHATPACVGGACALTACGARFLDCDGAAGNGCEIDGSSDPLNCGACGRACTGCVAGESPRTVFITAGTHNGALGGLSGADALWQAEADAAQLGGTYKAWLSDATGSPSTRFVHSNARYVRVDGVVVAESWDALAANGIGNTITVTAAGASLGAVLVWTNTLNSGTPAGSSSCTNWTSATIFGGATGRTTSRVFGRMAAG